MTSLSKNVYIDNLVDIANQYIKTFRVQIKINLVDVKSNIYIDFNKKIIRKILNLRLVIMEEYQNTKTLLQNVTL